MKAAQQVSRPRPSRTRVGTDSESTSLKISRDLPSGTVYKVLQAACGALSSAKRKPGDFSFTRDGVLSMELLTTFLLYAVADGNRYGIRHLLEEFWADARAQKIDLPTPLPVSASAICQARHRLPEGIFREILSVLAEQVSATAGSRCWRGRRVLAADGALVNVQRSAELVQELGIAKNCHTPQVRYSALVDVGTRMPIDFTVDGRMEAGEREQLFTMLRSLRSGDLLLLDRGYPSFEVLAKCVDAEVDFVIRCPTSQTFKFVDVFRDSGASESVIEIDLQQASSEAASPTKVRLVRVENGADPVIYITSLCASEATVREICELYHLRWEIEEYFKVATGEYAGQKQFRSLSPRGVRQEIGALTLHLALSRVLACEAEKAMTTDPTAFISQKAAVLTFHRHLIGLLLDDDPDSVRSRIQEAIERVQRALDRRRPSRSFPRVSWKPRRKWGPRGKTRA